MNLKKKKKKKWNAYNLYTNSLSFWPIYHQRSTDIPPTINGQRIGRVSAAISTEISAESPSICWPSLAQYLGWNISRYVDWQISVDILTNSQPVCLPTYRSALGWYVDRYIGRVSADLSTKMSTDMSVEGCTKYPWSENCAVPIFFTTYISC